MQVVLSGKVMRQDAEQAYGRPWVMLAANLLLYVAGAGLLKHASAREANSFDDSGGLSFVVGATASMST